MDVIARSLLPWLLCAAALFGQEPDEPEPPRYEGDPFAKIESANTLIDLQWRRAGNGDLEWAIAGTKEPKFARLFPDDLMGALRAGGIASYVVPLLHHGDLLSLTDGEAHLRWLGHATDTPALVAFARLRLASPAVRIDELDQLVAVDLLRARGDDAAKQALARLAADADAPAAVRARAAVALPRRERLGAADLQLPERSDLFVAIDHARLVDAHELLHLARLTGLVSTSMVMKMLKRPRADDAALGQSESDSMLELPFELVRRLGAMRFDHSCVSVRWLDAVGGEFTWTAATAGSFEPARIGGARLGLQRAGLEVAMAEDRAVAKWPGGSAVVGGRVATARTTGVDVAAREVLAKQILGGEGYSVRVQVPEGSKVLAAFSIAGFANTTAYELQATWGDPLLVVETFKMKDDTTATAMADKVGVVMERLCERLGQGDLFEKIGPPEVTVVKNVVTCVRKTPLALLPGLAEVRAKLLEKGRKGR